MVRSMRVLNPQFSMTYVCTDIGRLTAGCMHVTPHSTLIKIHRKVNTNYFSHINRAMAGHTCSRSPRSRAL
jgi:hypothetical protein